MDGIHLSTEQKEYDKNRTEDLKLFGIKEIRFTNEEVEKNISNVLKKILFEIKNNY